MKRSNNFTLSVVFMAFFSISFISCVLTFGRPEKETGIVSGRVNASATIALIQADGTTRTATTSTENPIYIFKEVPVGKAKIDTTIEEATTTQAIKVIANETTRVYPFGSSQKMDSALWGSVYEMDTTDTKTAKLENISWIPIGDEFFSNEINVPTRAFSEGFPGITDRFEWFAVVYEGAIVPPASGTYTFKLLCDDGARLYIDGDVVVEGDGIHVPLTYEGGVYLEEGEVYDFVLEYFQGPRFHIALVLEVQIPGREMRLFNMADFEWSDSE